VATAISPRREPWEHKHPPSPGRGDSEANHGTHLHLTDSLTYYLIFSTKYRRKLILPEFKEQFYQYIGGIIREKDGVLLEIGGIEDHIHIMAGIPSTIASIVRAGIAVAPTGAVWLFGGAVPTAHAMG